MAPVIKRKTFAIPLLEFSSPILKRDSKEITEADSKCHRSENDGSQLMPFEEKPWNTTKITILTVILSKEDLFKYLVEVGFIDHSNLKCKKCDGPLTPQYSSRYLHKTMCMYLY